MEFDRISGVENSWLEGRFSENEIWKMILDMKGDKALGSDGFTLFLSEVLGHC